jgi:hypothetical protein
MAFIPKANLISALALQSKQATVTLDTEEKGYSNSNVL